MPELAEVEFFRRRWSEGHGDRITAVLLNEHAKVFRGSNPRLLRRSLAGARLIDSETAAKQMLFRFDLTPSHRRTAKDLDRTAAKALPRAKSRGWLGLHLGMSGELRVESPSYVRRKHDHLVLVQKRRILVFNDPRMFGAVLFELSPQPPLWWTRIAPAILSPRFTAAAVAEFLRRRARAPIKAVLLMQERFPGVGNWMADEILWRAAIHPRRLAGSLSPVEVRTLHRECRNVCRQALDRIAGRGGKLPPDLNVNIPKNWLFWHRWEDGGRCPRTSVLLQRDEIGGRTTCWSPARQRL